MADKFERAEPEYSFTKPELDSFMNLPVWKAIEALWRTQRAIATDIVMSSRDSKDDDFFKGVVDQINYNLNLKEILLKEDKDEDLLE